MIAGCHDEIDVVVEEDVADLVVESATDQTNATDAQSDDKQEGGEQ